MNMLDQVIWNSPNPSGELVHSYCLHIPPSSHLRRLDLGAGWISGTDLRRTLQKFTVLESFSYDYGNSAISGGKTKVHVTLDIIYPLCRCQKLLELVVRGNQIPTGPSLHDLAGSCPRLRWLELHPASDEIYHEEVDINLLKRTWDVSSFAKHAASLEELVIPFPCHVTNRDILALSEHCPRLRVLWLGAVIDFLGLLDDSAREIISCGRPLQNLEMLFLAGIPSSKIPRTLEATESVSRSIRDDFPDMTDRSWSTLPITAWRPTVNVFNMMPKLTKAGSAYVDLLDRLLAVWIPNLRHLQLSNRYARHGYEMEAERTSISLHTIINWRLRERTCSESLPAIRPTVRQSVLASESRSVLNRGG